MVDLLQEFEQHQDRARQVELENQRKNVKAFAQRFWSDAEHVAAFEERLRMEKVVAFKSVDDDLAKKFSPSDIVKETDDFKAARKSARRHATGIAKTRTCQHFDIEAPPRAIWRGIKASTGIGKSHGAIEVLVENKGKHSADYLVPIIDKAHEVKDELVSRGVLAAIERGFTWTDPDWESRGIEQSEIDQDYYTPGKMCVQSAAVEAAGEAGMSIEGNFCGSCPFKGRCGAHQQRKALNEVRRENGVIIKTHAKLQFGSRAGQGDIIFCDEDPVRTLIDQAKLPAKKLSGESLEKMAGKFGKGDEHSLRTAGDLAFDAIKNGLPHAIIGKGHVKHLKIAKKILNKAHEASRPKAEGETDPSKIKEMASSWSNERHVASKILDQVLLAVRHKIPLKSTNLVVVNGKSKEIVCRWVKRLRIGQRRNVLFMSANLRKDRISASVKRDLKKDDFQEFSVDHNLEIFHYSRVSTSTSGLTGLLPDGSPVSGLSIQKAQYRRQLILDYIASHISDDENVLFVTNNKVRQAFLDEVPQSFVQHNSAELPGLNSFSHFTVCVVVGQSWPSVDEIERLAAAVALAKGKTIKTIKEWIDENPDVVLDEYGFISTEAGAWHPDPHVRTQMQIFTDDQIEQAAGRLRAVNSPKPKKLIIIRRDIPEMYASDTEQGSEASTGQGLDKVQMMDIYRDRAAKVGFLPITPMAAKSFQPQLFETRDAARKALSRAGMGKKSLTSSPSALADFATSFWRTFLNRIEGTEGSYSDVRQSSSSFSWRIDWKFPGKGPARQTALANREMTIADVQALLGVDDLREFRCQRLQGEGAHAKIESDGQSAEDVDRTALDPAADDITLLTSLDKKRPAAKRYREKDGEILKTDSPRPWESSAETITVSSIGGIASLLERIQEDTQKYLCRDAVIPGIDATRMRRLAYDTQDDEGRLVKKTMEDVPRRLFYVDVDDFRLPGDMTITGPEDVKKGLMALLRSLPPEFRGVACAVQLSNSMGLTSDPRTLKVHLWFRLKHAMTSKQLKEALSICLLKQVLSADDLQEVIRTGRYADALGKADLPVNFDIGVYNPIQILSTSRPICRNFEDPFKQRVFRFETKDGPNVVNLPIPKARPKRKLVIDEADNALADQDFINALKDIGGARGVHRAQLRAGFFATRAIVSGKISEQQAIRMMEEATRAAPSGGRGAREMESRARDSRGIIQGAVRRYR